MLSAQSLIAMCKAPEGANTIAGMCRDQDCVTSLEDALWQYPNSITTWSCSEIDGWSVTFIDGSTLTVDFNKFGLGGDRWTIS